MENMTQAEYANHRGVSRQAINKLVKAGKIPLKPNGRINAADADFALDGATERIRLRQEPGQESGFGDGHTSRLTQAKVGTEIYRARMAQLEYEERVGKLLPVADVQRAMERCAEIMGREIDRLPARTDDLAAAFTRDGVKGLRSAVKKLADELRRQIAESMTLEKQRDEEEQEAA